MAWTTFWDMHSGGGTKEGGYDKIYVELPEAQAIEYFKSTFGHDPYWVTCDCCGCDYSIEEDPTLEEATEFHRESGPYDGDGLQKNHMPLQQYLQREDILVVRKEDV